MEVVTDSIQRLYEGYKWTLTLEEPYVQSWFMVQSPIPTLTLIIIYYHIVYFGPKFMKNRKPVDLKWLLIIYNLGITLLNLYIVIAVFYYAYKLNYSIICQPYNPVDSPEEVHLASALWWYWFSKFIEFADTIFFIVRKKDRQLTFLHIYHHSTMSFLWWIGIKWVPNGSSFVGAGLNSIVHVLMYSYYGLSALGPSVRKYLWWKKYLTIIQLIQFTIALVLGINGIRTNCDFPMWMQYTLVTYMISFIVLFSNFYSHAYSKKGLYKKHDYQNGKAITNGSLSNGSAHNGNGKNGMIKNGSVHADKNECKPLQNGSKSNGHANGYCNGKTSTKMTNGDSNGHYNLHKRSYDK